MVQVVAPRWPRGISWLLLSVALGAAWPFALLAQTPGKAEAKKEAPKAAPAATAAPTPKEEAAKKPEVPPEAEAPPKPVEPVEIHLDPRAEKALVNNFPQLFTRPPAGVPAPAQFLPQAAAGAAKADDIRKYIQAQAKLLTDHDNIDALLNPGAAANNPKVAANVKKIEEATRNLLQPLTAAEKQPVFKKTYIQELIPVAQELLKNHLFARTQAMIVLSKTGDSQAIDTFVAQLNDPNQVIMVKLLAANGLTNAAQGGKAPPGPNDATKGARALLDFLYKEPNAFWMAQVRAFEALGALRRGSSDLAGNQADVADIAMEYLSNPKARPEVRAWAAWALGMIQVPGAVANFNYPLVAYHMGQLAAELGDRIADQAPEPAKYYTGFLYQIYYGLKGEQGVRESGLVTQAKGRGGVADLEKLVGQVVAAAITLSRSVGNQVPPNRAALKAKVNDLKAYLAKNSPKSDKLTPDGKAYPVNAPRMAEVAK
jgi:hypothetical protein